MNNDLTTKDFLEKYISNNWSFEELLIKFAQYHVHNAIENIEDIVDSYDGEKMREYILNIK